MPKPQVLGCQVTFGTHWTEEQGRLGGNPCRSLETRGPFPPDPRLWEAGTAPGVPGAIAGAPRSGGGSRGSRVPPTTPRRREGGRGQAGALAPGTQDVSCRRGGAASRAARPGAPSLRAATRWVATGCPGGGRHTGVSPPLPGRPRPTSPPQHGGRPGRLPVWVWSKKNNKNKKGKRRKGGKASARRRGGQ